MSRNRFIRRKRVGMFQVLLFLAFFITIGYAYLTQNLSITGTSFINNPRWDIYFDNIVVNPDSVELSGTNTPATIDQNNKTSVSFNVTLDKPGDFYEFTVDVKNAGSVPAKLNALPTVSGVSSAQSVYTTYTFTHTDGTAIAVGETLAAGASKNFKVRVEYKSDIQPSQLPTSAQNLTLTVAMQYVQA